MVVLHPWILQQRHKVGATARMQSDDLAIRFAVLEPARARVSPDRGRQLNVSMLVELALSRFAWFEPSKVRLCLPFVDHDANIIGYQFVDRH